MCVVTVFLQHDKEIMSCLKYNNYFSYKRLLSSKAWLCSLRLVIVVFYLVGYCCSSWLVIAMFYLVGYWYGLFGWLLLCSISWLLQNSISWLFQSSILLVSAMFY